VGLSSFTSSSESAADKNEGDTKANYNVSTSRVPKAPSSLVIDRLYLEAGNYLIGGVNMRLNTKNQPFWLQREQDYPSLLDWARLQAIVLYDVLDERAWLVDGLSALLHLVRVSIYHDENSEESPYDWVFDRTMLKDKWDGCSGRLSALKTLRSWDNLRLNLYVKSVSGSPEYATLGDRVTKILHSFEILIDRQVQAAAQDGIKIPHTLKTGRSVVGFDLLDVVTPLGPIDTRIKYLKSSGTGWADLLPAIGATVIFGSGLGDLIVPKEPGKVCGSWGILPKHQDYMAVSVSTLKMIWEERLQRLEPNLEKGQITSKIRWIAPQHPFLTCPCQSWGAKAAASHLNPVQYLVSQSSHTKAMPIDFTELDINGAVLFAPGPMHAKLTKRTAWKTNEHGVRNIQEGTNSDGTSGSSLAITTSAADSSESRSQTSTNLTVPSSSSPHGSDTPMTDVSDTEKVGSGGKRRRWNTMTEGLKK
jgi:hypothetical protein